MRALLLTLVLLLPLAASAQTPPVRVSPQVISLPAEATRTVPLADPKGPTYAVYVYENGDVERDYFSGSIPMFDPSASGAGQFTHVSSVGWDPSGRLEIEQSQRARAVDAGYIHSDGDSFSKFIVGTGGRAIGLLTLTEGRSFVFRLDVDQDGVVDIMGIHDAGIGRISHVVLEREDVIREYEELLAGRNTFCSRAAPTSSATGSASSFGISAQPDSQIDACAAQDSKLPNLRTGTGSSLRRGSQPSGMDAFCADVLASAAASPPRNSLAAQPPRSTGTPRPRTGQNVGEAIAEVGADLMDIGRAASSTPQGAVVGAPMSLIGAGLRLLGAAIAEASSEPLPGESVVFDWAGYCTDRAEQDANYDLDAINDRIAEKECGDPREASGPNQPGELKPLADRNCREPERFDDFEGLLSRVQDGCSPDPRPNAEKRCTNAGVPASGVRSDIRYADIAPPNLIKAFEEGVLPRVINPPRMEQTPSRDNRP